LAYPGVCSQQFFNHKTEIYPWFQNMPESFGPSSASEAAPAIESLSPGSIAKLPAMDRNPDQQVDEIRSTYAQLQIDCNKISRVLAQVQRMLANDESSTASSRLHVRTQTGYAILLCLALVFSAILHSFDPSDTTKSNETEALIDQVIYLTIDALQYRPLASSFMPVPIVFSLAIANDIGRRA
jgi:hypothetical protein